MNIDQKLLKAAFKLLQLLDKTTDENLPQEVANVVKLHSKLAVGSSFIPVPGLDIAAGAASIWGMYVRINNKIGLTVSDNILKTVGAGVGTNLAGYAAATGAASLIKCIPGIGTIGGAILMAATQYALTLASGFVYLQALILLAERGNGTLDFSQLGNVVNEVLKDKETIKEFIEAAKKDYKK